MVTVVMILPSLPKAQPGGDRGRDTVAGMLVKAARAATLKTAQAAILKAAQAAILTLLAASAACSPSPRETLHDLAALLPAAEVRASSAAADKPRGDRDAIFLPFGTEAVFHLDLPEASELVIAGLSSRGASSGSLSVSYQEDGGEPRRKTLSAGTGSQTVELPGPRVVRLTLRAEPQPARGGLLVSRPRVTAPAGREAATRPAGKPARRPNVIVYLVDTLRADRLGCYGYGRPVSPHLDRFAEEATLFETAVAQAPWTRPAVASILTGLGPLAHGVRTVHDRLPATAETLAERLHGAGYRTAAFSTNWNVSTVTGFAQGFDDFLFFPQEPDSGSVNRRVLGWLDRNPGREPFFLYIHTLDPHAPYEPPADLREQLAPGLRPKAGTLEDLRRLYSSRGKRRARMIEEVSRLYDAEVAANDRSFGALLEALRERKLYDETLIVFVSDHGEELGEHGGLGHAHSLYADQLNIPLVVKPASRAAGRSAGTSAGKRTSRLAQQLDLVPTILAAAGLPRAEGLPGADLFAPPGPIEPMAVSHLSHSGREGISVVQGGWKRIEPGSPRLGTAPVLYQGRDERQDLSGRFPVRNGFLAALLRAERLRSRQGLRPERADADEETTRGLKAHGYL